MGRSLTGVVGAALVMAACTSGASPDRSPNGPPTAASPSGAPTIGGPSPTPLPAGRIAFGTFDPAVDGFLIYTARPDGSDVKILLPGPHEIPIWSPDYTQIAVTGGGPGVFATIVHADGSGNRAVKLGDPTLSLGCAAWSPDGRQCAAEGWDDTMPGREGIYLVNLSDGSGLERLTSPKGGIHDIPGSFSPDGRRIVFVHGTDEANEAGELWVINVDGTKSQRLGDQLVGFGAAFSPDGGSIAAAYGHVIFIFDAADLAAAPRKVTVPAEYATHSVSWSPDGTRFVIGLYQPGVGRPNIYTMKIDGTDLFQVTHTTQESSFGAWGLPPG